MRVITALATVAIVGLAVYAGARVDDPQDVRGKPVGVLPRPAESLIHTTPGAPAPGVPAAMPAGRGVEVRIRILDSDTGRPTAARVNVIGADGNYYEPDANRAPLSVYSLHRTGNRDGKGPFRYFGWFFYTTGETTVRVPAGPLRVEAWKGFEYSPARVDTAVRLPATDSIEVRLQRAVDMERAGYVSGDTHLHFARDGTDETDERLIDLLAAEDVRIGFMLAMNDPRRYSPRMEDQIWPQAKYGAASVRVRGRHALISSQEYRANTFGHILLLAGRSLVAADGPQSDPNNWPVFGLVAQELHHLGGYAFHAHGGYSAGIYADFAQQKTDGVELLQFAEYRGIGHEGWYHILNAGFRFPAIGSSDYPYCRALSDCRTYVRTEGGLDTGKWLEAAAAGRSFFTTGPLLQLAVDGHRPGDVVAIPSERQVMASLRLDSPAAAVTDLELIVNGRVAQHETLAGNGPWQRNWDLTLREPAWVAAHAFAHDPQGRQDAEAHTNPIYFEVDGRRRKNLASIDWLIAKLDGRIAYQAGRVFPQKEKVLEYYRQSRQALLELKGSDRWPFDARANPQR